MKSWMRIIIAVFVLVGSTLFFGSWSLNQFDNAFDNLSSASYVANVANTLSTSSSFKKDAELVSTSPEISGALATSTDLELSFTFPQKGDQIYTGCTYLISWQSSTTVSSIETSLVDAGTRKSMGPIASGLAKENAVETDSQNLNWKVRNVWPGEYYIAVSNVNDTDTEERSKTFTINEMPKESSIEEQKNICEESGGSF